MIGETLDTRPYCTELCGPQDYFSPIFQSLLWRTHDIPGVDKVELDVTILTVRLASGYHELWCYFGVMDDGEHHSWSFGQDEDEALWAHIALAHALTPGVPADPPSREWLISGARAYRTMRE